MTLSKHPLVRLASVALGVGLVAGFGQQTESGRKLTTRTPLVYPAIVRNLRLEGTVRLRVNVAPNGVAKSSEVLGGNAVFSKAAQEAVTNWKWAPAPQESQELVNLSFHP